MFDLIEKIWVPVIIFCFLVIAYQEFKNKK